MYVLVALAIGASLLASSLLTLLVRAFALKKGMLDVPNARSSHVQAVPRGGGFAFVAVFVAGAVLLSVGGFLSVQDLLLLVPPGLAVALIGALDDRYGMSPKVRICVHILASLYVVAFLALADDAVFTGQRLHDVAVCAVAVVLLTWLVNLYNFMDGIDSLAATEAIFVCMSLAVFAWLRNGSPVAALPCMVLAGAVGGFLIFNWPPARIFMGDVGSGFLGMILGVLAVLVARRSGLSLFAPLILLAVFVVDATCTLLRRVLSGQRWHEGHRTHAYQRLSRRWGGHLPVVWITALVNVVWLLPLALVAVLHPQYAHWMALAAYLPLIAVVAGVGAGKAEV